MKYDSIGLLDNILFIEYHLLKYYVLKYAIIVNLVLIAKELILNDDKGDMKKSINYFPVQSVNHGPFALVAYIGIPLKKLALKLEDIPPVIKFSATA